MVPLIRALEEAKAGYAPERNSDFYRGIMHGMQHAIDIVRRAANPEHIRSEERERCADVARKFAWPGGMDGMQLYLRDQIAKAIEKPPAGRSDA